VKDTTVLDAAYNDAAGVTAAFNLNMLAHVNRELGSDFDLAAFRHRAFFDRARSRVEMHLESLRDQRVDLGSHSVAFAAGETIHSENSCKYTIGGFRALATRAGFRPQRVWTDDRGWFSVHYLAAR